jgi:hypothetical protein
MFMSQKKAEGFAMRDIFGKSNCEKWYMLGKTKGGPDAAR